LISKLDGEAQIGPDDADISDKRIITPATMPPALAEHLADTYAANRLLWITFEADCLCLSEAAWSIAARDPRLRITAITYCFEGDFSYIASYADGEPEAFIEADYAKGYEAAWGEPDRLFEHEAA
jgi:hypothetical protein